MLILSLQLQPIRISYLNCKNFHASSYLSKVLNGLDIKPEEIGENEFRRTKRSAEEKRKMKGQLIKSMAMMLPPRHTQMPIDQDWPSVWPVAASYKASVVPLPLRQGKTSRKKIPPSDIGNLELMKIPNFLHLTPPAIKQQCEAIKKFCTPWPKALSTSYKNKGLFPFHNLGSSSISGVYGLDFVKTEQLLPPGVNNPYSQQNQDNLNKEIKEQNVGLVDERTQNKTLVEISTKSDVEREKFEEQLDRLMAYHYPVEITTTDYCFSGPSSKDNRARRVTMEVHIESLKLNYHATDKLLRLVKERYNPETKKVTITADRCPLSLQNKDYAFYLLTALFHESRAIAPWEENGKTLKDLEMYFWYKMPSSDLIVQTVKNLKKVSIDKGHLSTKTNSSPEEGSPKTTLERRSNFPDYLKDIEASISKEEICQVPIIRDYAKMVTAYHDSPTETDQSVQVYKEHVKKLLGIPVELEH